MHTLTRAFCCLGLCAVFLGCGGANYSGAKRYPLSGEVTLDGQPVDLGSITFTPADGKGRPCGGVITDGKYDVSEEQGASAGSYRVEIHWLRRTGKKLKDAESGEIYDERKEAIPAKLNASLELSVEVPLPQNRHDFKLKSS